MLMGLVAAAVRCSSYHYRLVSVCLYFVLFVYVIVEWKDSMRPTTKTMPMTTTHSLDESMEITFIFAKVASHQCKATHGKKDLAKRMQCLNNNLNLARSFDYLLCLVVHTPRSHISYGFLSYLYLDGDSSVRLQLVNDFHSSPKRIGHGVKHGILPILHRAHHSGGTSFFKN